jgi:two-component system, NtrC family, response regulator AtoC
VDKLQKLRKRAEESLENGSVDIHDTSALSAADLKTLVHELQVHQIELEMQNEELRRIQHELEESHSRYSELYEFAPAGYFTLDQQSVIREVNLTGARLLSKERSFLIKIPFSKFVHPDDLRTFLLHLRHVFRDGDKHVCEVRLNKNGEEFFVRLESVGSKDADGSVTGCRTILTDMTKRRQAEQALENSEHRFRAICESTEEIILIKDKSRRITYANPAAEQIFGNSGSTLIGRTTEDVFGPESSTYCQDMDIRVLAGDAVEEEHVRTVKGAPLVFLESRIPMRDRSGKVDGILFLARDITDRKVKGFAPAEPEPKYPSTAMQSTLKMARVAAPKGVTILLLGESGSGKDYLAKYIHDHSPRASGPYFSINCAALPPELAESELFGHEKGSFTGAIGRKKGLLELAEGGTLLLNEIGELSLPLQAKLLTFLDTRKFTRVGGEKEVAVNARLIAATNRNLGQEVQAGRFREDLFYRLNVLPITVPPLRHRKEDIPILVQEMVERIQGELQLPAVSPIDSRMMQAFMQYDWPGNVRELRNVLERALMLSGGETLTLKNLGVSLSESETEEWAIKTTFPSEISLNAVVSDFKRALIEEALRRTGGRRQEAARLLGISRYSLKHYMRSLNMWDQE